MTCKVRVVKKSGREIEYENAVFKREKSMFSIYELEDIATCMKPVATFDPCKVKAVYVDRMSVDEAA